MQALVDLNSLFNIATDVKEAREESLSVSVYLDESAPAELVAYIRNAFASSSGHVRMTVSYVGETFAPHPTDDFAVLVVGDTNMAGKQAASVRSVGVPVMVVTLLPGRVNRLTEHTDFAIPQGDIVSPWEDEDVDGGVFTEEAALALNERMGRWIVSVCRPKRLAFAIAFPFMRRALANDSVQVTAIENAGIAIIPLFTGADLPIMTLNQAKMVLQIAAAYGGEIDSNRLKEIAFVICGAFLSRSLARKLVAAVPVLGFAFKTGVAYASTLAMGYAVIEYFEGGQDMTGVANVIECATEKGTKALSGAQDKAGVLSPVISNVASSVLSKVKLPAAE